MMSKKNKKSSAKETINRLAVVISNPSDTSDKITQEEQDFMNNAMEIVNEWRTESLIEKGQLKQKRFKEFIDSVRNLLQTDLDEQKVVDSQLVASAQMAAFYRKLTHLNNEAQRSVIQDQELLELWVEFCQTEEE